MSLTDKREIRKFGLIVGLILIVMGTIPMLKGKDLNFYLIYISVILWFTALTIPYLLFPIYKAWMWIGKVLGRINSFLILSLIFYFVVTPIGLIFRMFKTNSDKFAYRIRKDSYWVKRDYSRLTEDMKRIF